MRVKFSGIITIVFFLFMLAVGSLTYKDYGIPWDEPDQIYIAKQNQNYVFHNDPALLSIRDKYYGVVFELPILWLTTYTSIPRHWLVFITFFFGLLFFYALANRLFRNQWWSLLSTVTLAASPRIFADSFYNSKDIPFLVIGIVAAWSLVLFSDKLRQQAGGWTFAGLLLLHSLTSAAMIGTRVAGVLIIPLTLLVLIIDFIQFPATWIKVLLALIGYLVLTVALTVLVWPVLWHAPWAEFLGAFHKMSRLPYDISMLFMGKYIYASKLPWDYLPVWIGVTSPLIVVAGFFVGIFGWIGLIWKGWRSRGETGPVRQNFPNHDLLHWIIVFLWLFIPVAAIYYFHSVLYDGWRHMFFVYPPILLVSILGLKSLYQWLVHWTRSKLAVKIALGLLVAAGLLEPAWFMARNHPYENVYFNLLAGDPAGLRGRYEMDYWGLSYKQGIDAILARDPGRHIKIAVANNPGDFYIKFGLPPEQQSRIIEVQDPQDADYFVTNYRWHPQEYPYPDLFFSVKVRGEDIMAVYKMH